jgi:hypothetical protein
VSPFERRSYLWEAFFGTIPGDCTHFTLCNFEMGHCRFRVTRGAIPGLHNGINFKSTRLNTMLLINLEWGCPIDRLNAAEGLTWGFGADEAGRARCRPRIIRAVGGVGLRVKVLHHCVRVLPGAVALPHRLIRDILGDSLLALRRREIVRWPR